MNEYTATTANATNKITATLADERATLLIEVNGEEIENETSATWDEGENEVTITVSGDGDTNVYSVAVTYTTGG